MRILHIDPDDMDNPLSGGGPVRTFEICRRLAQRHEVTVLTPTFPGSTPEKMREGIRYVRIGRRVGDHGSSHHITFFVALPRVIRRMKYDLLVEDLMPPMSATFNPLFSRGPMIGSVQWFFAKALSRQYRIPFYLGERYLLKLYRNLVVLTEEMRSTVMSYHRRARCRVIPNGVPEELFTANRDHGDFILYLGRVDLNQKGVDLLLRAYARVPEGRRLPLVVAGHGYQWAEYQALVRQLKLEKWISTPGRVNAEQRVELLSRCRFVCVPSREETFGMVILEACAAARPVVLFDRSPMNEVAAPGCVTVPAYDIDAYAEAMADMAGAGQTEVLARGSQGRKWATRFRWEEISKRQEAFYLETLQGANG